LNTPRKKYFLGISGAESEGGYAALIDVTTIEVSKNVMIKSCRTTVGSVVSCGCETWCHIQEHRLRMCEIRVLRRIFGPKRDEGTGDWRRLHNGELHDLYSLPNIIWVIKSRRMRWGRKRRFIHGLVGKPEGKRALGRAGCRWEDNSNVDCTEI
jgi:hypothetical protein